MTHIVGKPLQEIAVAEGFDTVAKLDGVIDVIYNV